MTISAKELADQMRREASALAERGAATSDDSVVDRQQATAPETRTGPQREQGQAKVQTAANDFSTIPDDPQDRSRVRPSEVPSRFRQPETHSKAEMLQREVAGGQTFPRPVARGNVAHTHFEKPVRYSGNEERPLSPLTDQSLVVFVPSDLQGPIGPDHWSQWDSMVKQSRGVRVAVWQPDPNGDPEGILVEYRFSEGKSTDLPDIIRNAEKQRLDIRHEAGNVRMIDFGYGNDPATTAKVHGIFDGKSPYRILTVLDFGGAFRFMHGERARSDGRGFEPQWRSDAMSAVNTVRVADQISAKEIRGRVRGVHVEVVPGPKAGELLDPKGDRALTAADTKHLSLSFTRDELARMRGRDANRQPVIAAATEQSTTRGADGRTFTVRATSQVASQDQPVAQRDAMQHARETINRERSTLSGSTSDGTGQSL